MLLSTTLFMLNLEWLRTFKAIYESGNLSNAANRLLMSQPGAGLHLNSLEEYIGYRLFERDRRKMIATEQAKVLYHYICDSINTLAQAEDTFCKNSSDVKPTLALGMGFGAFEQIAAEHFAQLPYNLTVRFGDAPSLVHELCAGTLDLALTSQIETHPNLEYTTLTSERVLLVCGSGANTDELNALIVAGKRVSIMQWLKKQLWYTTSTELSYLQNFWLANFECAPGFRPNFILPHFGAILRCIRNGNGFAVMPEFLCTPELQRGAVRLAWEGDHIVAANLYFAKRRKNRHETAIRQLQALLTKNMHQHSTRPVSLINE